MLENSQKKNAHSDRNEKVCFEEHEVDKFDFTGCEVVPQWMFSDRSFPKATFKSGTLVFNAFAIKKLDECAYIQIFAQPEKNRLIVRQSAENEEDAVQWSRLCKHGKVLPKKINDTAQIYEVLKWDKNIPVKLSGNLNKSRERKMLVFQPYDD